MIIVGITMHSKIRKQKDDHEITKYIISAIRYRRNRNKPKYRKDSHLKLAFFLLLHYYIRSLWQILWWPSSSPWRWAAWPRTTRSSRGWRPGQPPSWCWLHLNRNRNQESKWIRQWQINWCTSPMMIPKVIPSVD